MKKIIVFITLSFALSPFHFKAQDTFSILAFDSITREVGAAGASCVNLFSFPGFSNDFICELFPDTGAIASQASYISTNQANARIRMRAGDSPTQILNWLNTNDAGANPNIRQYGALKLSGPSPRTAAFTGTACLNYKNHIVGPNYTIHGNILLGQKVLDSMEARFKRQEGDLACKLMAAMQGANMVGADTRCAANGSSSLFAFLKVTLPTDTFGKPRFRISLKTQAKAGIEPIDSLQKMFDAARTCTVINTARLNNHGNFENNFFLFQNQMEQTLSVKSRDKQQECQFTLMDNTGRVLKQDEFVQDLNVDLSQYQKGIYFITIRASDKKQFTRKIILE